MAAAGDGSADVGVGELNYFPGFGGKQFLEKIFAAGDAEFLRENAERILGGHEVDAGDAGVSFEGAKCLAGEDDAGCAGDGEGDFQASSS